MMEQLIVLLVLLAVMAVMSFVIQFFVFMWIVFRGMSGTIVMDAEKRILEKMKGEKFQSVKERSQTGQIVGDDESEDER
jgi:hypothetical protein